MDKRAVMLGVFLFAVILSSFILSSFIVSAIDLSQGSEDLVNLVKDIFSPIVSAFLRGFSDEYLLEYFLFFMIIVSFVYIALGQIELLKSKIGALWTITIAVGILSTRFIATEGFVKLVLQPYNILGVAVLSIIPLIIFFFFIESFDAPIARKFGWSLFIVLYFYLWYSQSNEIGNVAYVYLFASIIGLILILSDKHIRGWLARGFVRKGLNASVAARMADLQGAIDSDMARLGNVPADRRKSLQDRIDKNIVELKRISRTFKV